jgi:hypothetical protein
MSILLRCRSSSVLSITSTVIPDSLLFDHSLLLCLFDTITTRLL